MKRSSISPMMNTKTSPDLQTNILPLVLILNAPTEILQQIFKCCQPDAHAPHTQPFSSAEAPLLLCQVCALWRTIAIATPQLWARLAVSIGENNRVQPLPPLITIWVARSGSQPLTFVLCASTQGVQASETVNAILQIFLPHIHRWQNITFILPHQPIPTPFALVPGGDLLLQMAKFEFGDTAANSPQISGLSRLLNSSPQLHTLYWGNDLELLNISWARLTVIDLIPAWRPMFQITQIMQSAPRLRSLSAYINRASTAVDRIVLPDLVVLWLWSRDDMNPLFQQLSAPALRNINVFADFLPGIPQVEVVRCIARSRCRLDVAIFNSLHIPEADLIALLRSQHALRLLEIRAATVTDQFLALLTLRGTPYLCPDLRIIRLLGCSFSSADGSLADMVASRRTELAKPVLSTLVVYFSSVDLPRHAEDVRHLKDLENEAFRVWINRPETESG